MSKNNSSDQTNIFHRWNCAHYLLLSDQGNLLLDLCLRTTMFYYINFFFTPVHIPILAVMTLSRCNLKFKITIILHLLSLYYL